MRASLALLVTLALAACSDPNRYNLACSGKTTLTSGPQGHQTTAAQAWSDRYIVDLTAKKWCRPNDCTTLADFDEITPDTLTLYDTQGPSYPPKFNEQAYVRRTTGEFVADVTPILPDALGDGGHTTGTCHKARFSGFPRKIF